MSKARTYEYVIRDGKPVAVPVPRGSATEAGVIKENMIGVIAGAALRRLIGRR